MRAMELGLTQPDEHSWTPAATAVSIGAGVPIAVMFIAFIAVGKAESSDALWMAATMIGIAGVICGSTLAGMQLSKRNQVSAASTVEKPAYEPDEFDVVGSRG
jgi:hypothetical protein